MQRGSFWRVLIYFVVIGSVSYPLRAQDGSPSVMAGTKLRVEFMGEVGTSISRVNDGVQVRVIKLAEAQSRKALPAGTVLSGRVLAVHRGDKHTKSYPMIRLGFDHAALPDGRWLPLQVSLADLGVSEYVDS